MLDVRRADLHMHTTCSDGRLAPADLVARTRACGLHAIAITDHDCIDALPDAFEAGRQHHVEVVAGVELSATVGEQEVHLLGYFFDPEHAGLRAHLDAFQEARRARAAGMVERLHGLGVEVSLGQVLERAGGRSVGRVHVAEALHEAGHIAEPREAFDRYIGDGGPAFVAKPLFPAAEALALLHEAGGIGVLAHPGHWTADATLMTLIRAGLDGLETIHPSHDASLTRYYRGLARDFALLETGGSDYHGPQPDGPERLGRYSIPFAWFERARHAAAHRAVT